MALTAALPRPRPTSRTSGCWRPPKQRPPAASPRSPTTSTPTPSRDWRRRATPATRIRCVIAKFLLDETIERGLRPATRSSDLLTVGPLKIFMDGSLNTRTAYCHDHYPGGDYDGELLEPLDELLPLLRKAVDHGIGLALHAIGDRANTLALDAFAALGVGGRIEHAQLLDPADVPRFAALDVVAGVQPAHQPDDRDAADHHWSGRTDRAFAYAALHRAGARPGVRLRRAGLAARPVGRHRVGRQPHGRRPSRLAPGAVPVAGNRGRGQYRRPHHGRGRRPGRPGPGRPGHHGPTRERAQGPPDPGDRPRRPVHAPDVAPAPGAPSRPRPRRPRPAATR